MLPVAWLNGAPKPNIDLCYVHIHTSSYRECSREKESHELHIVLVLSQINVRKTLVVLAAYQEYTANTKMLKWYFGNWKQIECIFNEICKSPVWQTVCILSNEFPLRLALSLWLCVILSTTCRVYCRAMLGSLGKGHLANLRKPKKSLIK